MPAIKNSSCDRNRPQEPFKTQLTKRQNSTLSNSFNFSSSKAAIFGTRISYNVGQCLLGHSDRSFRSSHALLYLGTTPLFDLQINNNWLFGSIFALLRSIYAKKSRGM